MAGNLAEWVARRGGESEYKIVRSGAYALVDWKNASISRIEYHQTHSGGKIGIRVCANFLNKWRDSPDLSDSE